MENFSPTETFITRMIIGLILSFGMAKPTLNQSINSPRTKQDILKISPAKLVEKVGQKIKANPKMTSSEVTAFANSLLEQNGYDYTFDVCEFISKPVSDMNQKDGTFLFRSFLKRVDGTKQLIQFSSGDSAPCGECFAKFPVRKFSTKWI